MKREISLLLSMCGLFVASAAAATTLERVIVRSPSTDPPSVNSFKAGQVSYTSVTTAGDDCCTVYGELTVTLNATTYDCDSNEGGCQDVEIICPCPESDPPLPISSARILVSSAVGKGPELLSTSWGSENILVLTAQSGTYFDCNAVTTTLNASSYACDGDDGPCQRCSVEESDP